MKMSKIFVTGGSGKAGKHLIPYLLDSSTILSFVAVLYFANLSPILKLPHLKLQLCSQLQLRLVQF